MKKKPVANQKPKPKLAKYRYGSALNHQKDNLPTIRPSILKSFNKTSSRLKRDKKSQKKNSRPEESASTDSNDVFEKQPNQIANSV